MYALVFLFLLFLFFGSEMLEGQGTFIFENCEISKRWKKTHFCRNQIHKFRRLKFSLCNETSDLLLFLELRTTKHFQNFYRLKHFECLRNINN